MYIWTQSSALANEGRGGEEECQRNDSLPPLQLLQCLGVEQVGLGVLKRIAWGCNGEGLETDRRNTKRGAGRGEASLVAVVGVCVGAEAEQRDGGGAETPGARLLVTALGAVPHGQDLAGFLCGRARARPTEPGCLRAGK